MCKSLGFSFADKFSSSNKMSTIPEYDDYYLAEKTVLFNKLKCNGGEANINECVLNGSKEICVSKSKAAVVCNSKVAELGNLKLNFNKSKTGNQGQHIKKQLIKKLIKIIFMKKAIDQISS